MNILIGSRALSFTHQKFRPRFICKSDADWDIISSDKFEDPKIEVHDPSILLNDELSKFAFDLISLEGKDIYVLNLMGLAIVKRSHLWRDLSFDKHITMYHNWLAKHMPKEDHWAYDYYKRRTEATIKMFSKGHPNLMQGKDGFSMMQLLRSMIMTICTNCLLTMTGRYTPDY